MASYTIKWKASAKKELKKIDKKEIPKILKAVASFATDPHPANHKKLLGTDHIYRIRVGNYRIVYSLEENELIIEIVRVKHRKDVYKK